ncbi:hypothetical protein XF30_19970 [Bradyrhizobium sp. SUTN9-2]|uniref:hypothetical protein n=1 Tax=Bradyrhizobium sp. SUTN9-2 TaxID=1167456 RepID=UPI000D65906F|nr:hypothetical protein [Bradyrhizobium sp. SUTN9-2]PWE78687.1 hypothetical protein XF30_19970 [Bradyrhizobium sp. SUTN9-2]
MISLKSYLPYLADYLDLTSDALYERQRVLVRSKMLKAIEGRGPGSGIRAVPATVTQLVLATLATDSLADTASKTKTLSRAAAEQGLCPLTGARTFADALEVLVSSEALAKKLLSVVVRRPDLTATVNIIGQPMKSAEVSIFGKRTNSERRYYSRTVEASLPGGAIEEIGNNLRQIASDWPKKTLFQELEASRRTRSR